MPRVSRDREEARATRRRQWKVLWRLRRWRKGHIGKLERRYFRSRIGVLRMVENQHAKKRVKK